MVAGDVYLQHEIHSDSDADKIHSVQYTRTLAAGSGSWLWLHPPLRTAPCPRRGGGGLQLLQLQVVVVQLHAGSRPIGHGSR